MRDRVIVGAFVLALLTFGGLGWAAVDAFDAYGDQTAWVDHTHRVRTGLGELLGALRDVEVGQRGYLLAGEEVFLEPYEAAVHGVKARIEDLRTLTADNPEQTHRLDELAVVVDEKLAFVAETIEVQRRGAAEEARAMVATGRGKVLMDDLRRRIGEMEEAEQDLLEVRSSRAEAQAWRTWMLLAGGNIFAFTLLATATMVIGRELNRRRRLEAALSLASEREQLVAHATRSEAELAVVLDSLPVGVVVGEPDTASLRFHNARLRTLCGGCVQPGATEVELDVLRADGTPYPGGGHPLVRAARFGEVVPAEEVRLRHPDGSEAEAMVQAAPVRAPDGRVIGVVGVFQDLGELRRAEAQRVRSEHFGALFLSALGHDLRNPLTVITAGAASLARRVHDPGQARVVERMASSAERMNRMIGQLIELTRFRLAGGPVLERARVELRALIGRVAAQIEVTWPERTLRVDVGTDVIVDGDPAQLEGVVLELLRNAMEHGRADQPVEVVVATEGEEAVVDVRSRGAPIDPELLQMLFDPFRRAAERRRTKSIGLGLGLYLAAEVVEAHGGRIVVTSEAERGTTFRLVLPRPHG